MDSLHHQIYGIYSTTCVISLQPPEEIGTFLFPRLCANVHSKQLWEENFMVTPKVQMEELEWNAAVNGHFGEFACAENDSEVN